MIVSLKIPRLARAYLVGALEGLVAVNRAWMHHHDVPSLYSSGVVYRREIAGREAWDCVPVVLGRGWGDCEDLAAWRVAELREHGIPAWPWVRRTGPSTLHALVRRLDGFEDPSRTLGMR